MEKLQEIRFSFWKLFTKLLILMDRGELRRPSSVITSLEDLLSFGTGCREQLILHLYLTKTENITMGNTSEPILRII